MKKAILVNDFVSVGALNKMLEEGYEVQSADERGVYILAKEDNIKKSINTNLSTNITLDKKQPHVRIEFDDIHDVPKVWVDGELIGEVDGKPLVSLKVNWQTDTDVETHKAFDIKYLDLTGERLMSEDYVRGQ